MCEIDFRKCIFEKLLAIRWNILSKKCSMAVRMDSNYIG